MPSTLEIIHEAEALPVEEYTLVVDSLLQTLNHPDPTIEKKMDRGGETPHGGASFRTSERHSRR